MYLPHKENHTGWKIHSRGPKYFLELELPGEVQELLREAVNKKKEWSVNERKGTFGTGNNTHAKGKNCAEPQSTNAGTNKKVKGSLVNTSLLSTSTHMHWRQNHEQEGPCPHGAYSVVRKKEKRVKSIKWSSGSKQGATIIMLRCFT